MYAPQERPEFESAWENCSHRVLMGGMGDDTAMMIAEMYERGYEPDEVVFCDTGSEFPHTYKFIEHLREWMSDRNWSKLTVLRKLDKFGEPLSLIGMCKAQNTLPAAAFGSKSCSLRFKAETADKYFNNSCDCWKAWGVERKGARISSYTGKVLRIVGINADEPKRAAKWKPELKYVQAFPLVDWSVGEHSSVAVERVGLYYPGKSSCTICPHMSAQELIMLRDQYPDKFQEALDVESGYIKCGKKSDSTTVGLCRGKTIAKKIEQFETKQ